MHTWRAHCEWMVWREMICPLTKLFLLFLFLILFTWVFKLLSRLSYFFLCRYTKLSLVLMVRVLFLPLVSVDDMGQPVCPLNFQIESIGWINVRICFRHSCNPKGTGTFRTPLPCKKLNIRNKITEENQNPIQAYKYKLAVWFSGSCPSTIHDFRRVIVGGTWMWSLGPHVFRVLRTFTSGKHHSLCQWDGTWGNWQNLSFKYCITKDEKNIYKI